MMKGLMIYLIFVGNVCFGQFNDTINYYLNYTSTGLVNKTNDGRSYVLNNNFRLGVSKKRVSMNISSLWIYGKQNESRTNNDLTAALDFNFYEKRQPARFYIWGLASY